jgi:hypothetical protein
VARHGNSYEKGFIVHSMRTTGELTWISKYGERHAHRSCVASSLLFDLSLVEMRRCWRRYVRKEAAQS